MSNATNGTSTDNDVEMREFAQMLEQVFGERRGDDHRLTGPLRLDRELWSTLVELGLARLTGPEADGGSEAGWAEAAYLLGAAGAGAAAVPVAENDLLAGWLLQLSGCKRAVTDPAAARTAAVVAADGSARHVPWARDVDAVVVLWEADGTWRVADVARADVEVTEAVDVASEPRDHIRVDVAALSGAEVPAGTAEEFLRRGALARALAMSGAMERVLDLVVEHTTTRVQFGRALGKFQAVQHLVSDIAAEGALARAAAQAAVTIAEDSGFGSDEAGFAIAAAKSCAGHAASVVVRNAHQSLGAIGFTMEHELHRHANRLLSWRREFGSVRFWDEVLTAAAVDAGSRGLWPLIADGRPE
ncbi:MULTISPECIES: acyl-CoA dehydrogenase family protein [Rhodococcus]|uniref:acyl-CoA dehydrogenase family protein n=1 Tax=Rhodococcus TaxID=1827 RepID=UPI001639CB9C|nr:MULTISPECIES: acyl-CoA dehydrogenase [Rhodococcus]MBC2589460.1 acyl-CoA dehydrogenase [Rhodococcus aetherivorans]QRI77540.1 acyl-CoA dehydrogenase [Rhodococcus aetherivorans]QSE60959.1 acyl-CoA dehydrogenase [Rhodococcus sp. PSBB066]QSE67734.1 acyl-CoA dehydrogenase [Rhodococcus sp. PSBB049]